MMRNTTTTTKSLETPLQREVRQAVFPPAGGNPRQGLRSEYFGFTVETRLENIGRGLRRAAHQIVAC